MHPFPSQTHYNMRNMLEMYLVVFRIDCTAHIFPLRRLRVGLAHARLQAASRGHNASYIGGVVR